MSIGTRIYAELKGDRVIWMIVAVLALFSVLAVYSATGTLAYRERGGNTEAYLLKHGFILGLGLFITYLCYLIHYTRYKQMAPWLMVIAIPLLMYTIFLGEDINNARRWIELPFVGITFQTSDFAKLALIIFVAREITRHKDYIKDFNKAFLPILVPIVIICGLIAPADLSTALILFTTSVLMLFVGRVDLRYILLLLFLGVVVFALLIAIGRFFPDVVRVETWVSRVSDFITDPDGDYQVRHGKIAIASGQYFGLGPGNSVMRNYLPAPYSDFIYSIICEEYGLVGGFVILFLYVLLFVRTVTLVTKSPKAFGAMVAIGISLNLVIQALANMAVSVNLVPVTGLTLPMVSMGGTSVLFTCISFGILLSVSKYIEQLSAQQAQEEQ
ncbi:MAG: FtsW/RodA/SpoVE family cell cycle protein [Saprospiraceae bacterium]|nr:FtsW/RodA/SpoVE family cell cycle protein [Saprospiraceae bacterium]MCB0679278.1 FtsW/RodA/SpoVE family cell cycle protein [Saprospiraceae bacterium]MCB0680139.1 FtsW/RodA/SpoVE family cell cycle protein [Saprospiraceae bacterium]